MRISFSIVRIGFCWCIIPFSCGITFGYTVARRLFVTLWLVVALWLVVTFRWIVALGLLVTLRLIVAVLCSVSLRLVVSLCFGLVLLRLPVALCLRVSWSLSVSGSLRVGWSLRVHLRLNNPSMSGAIIWIRCTTITSVHIAVPLYTISSRSITITVSSQQVGIVRLVEISSKMWSE